MWENLQVKRMISQGLPGVDDQRIVLITGARQTGKTTLVKSQYPDLPYFNLDAIEYRDQLSSISTFKWAKEVGRAVIDEIQKEPSLLDKIKFAYDEGAIGFSVLTGSSQILLLQRIRETLAGRVSLHELFPFMFNELLSPEGRKVSSVMFSSLLSDSRVDDILSERESVILGERWDQHMEVEKWLMTWGGMAPLIHITREDERKYWLRDYVSSYLERDLADLASLRDLRPFRKFEQITALRVSNLISYSSLAKDTGIGIETARRYMEYLRISYQAFMLQPYFKNLTSSLVKTPKLYWFDNGLLRHLSGMGFQMDNGQLFENYLASELMKFIRTNRLENKLYFYRTRSGMEVDFIVTTNNGILGMEVKNRDTVIPSDFTNLKKLAEASGKDWSGGLVIYRGNKIQQFGTGLWAIPSTRLLS
jgi:predicted AAA+ superfamily ATPase